MVRRHALCVLLACGWLANTTPRQAGLSRLKFNASTQEECEHNLRVFEKALLSCKVHKELDIPRLAKGTFQHTFELLQWCYEYLHTHYPDADYKYRAYERRQLASESYLVATRLDVVRSRLTPHWCWCSQEANGPPGPASRGWQRP